MERTRAAGWLRLVAGALWVSGLLISESRVASAQTIWEVTPYRVQVWVALAADPTVPRIWREQLPAQLELLASTRVGAVWQLQAANLPAALAADVRREYVWNLDELADSEPTVRALDKLIVATVAADPQGYRLRVRELDVRSRTWSGSLERTVPTGGQLADMLLAMACEVFLPMLRIERIEEQQVIGSLQAAALTRPEDSPRAWRVPTELAVGDLLHPFVRRTDRSGVVTAAGVQPVDWTVLTVAQRQGGTVVCEFESGYRQPFRTRRSPRIEQLARQIKPLLPTTTLVLIDRKEPHTPLAGYELYTKLPQSEKTELVGRTDWRGQISLPRQDDQVRVLFVRSGQQLLGKLPLVPGDQPSVTAPLRNDAVRLEAEGFLMGVQDSLVDLVARREVLASRIRKQIDAGQVAQATELLKELRRLDTQDDFARRVQQRKQALSSADAQVQQKIDQLFAQTRTLLGKYLNQEQVDQLTAALASAEARSPEGSESVPSPDESP